MFKYLKLRVGINMFWCGIMNVTMHGLMLPLINGLVHEYVVNQNEILEVEIVRKVDV